MHVRPRFACGRNTVDGANGGAVDQNDPLIALRDVRQKLLGDQRLAVDTSEKLVQRSQIAIIGAKAEHTRTAISIKRLEDHIAMLGLKRLERFKIARNRGGRGQLWEIQNQKLFWVVAHPKRIVDDQRPGVDPVQKMRRGDVGHIKWRILTEPYNIEIFEIDRTLGAKVNVIALHASHGEIMPARCDIACLIGKLIRRIVEKPVPARLRLFSQTKRAVSIDINLSNRIHLKRDFKRFGRHRRHSITAEPLHDPAGRQVQWRQNCPKAFSRISTAPPSSTSATSKRASVSCPFGCVPRNCAAEAMIRPI